MRALRPGAPVPKVVATAAFTGLAAGGGGGLEAVAGSAPASASGALEPRESGKGGLEGPWGRPLPSGRCLTWAPARRAVRAESPADEPALQGSTRPLARRLFLRTRTAFSPRVPHGGPTALAPSPERPPWPPPPPAGRAALCPGPARLMRGWVTRAV